tara:strand:- start:3534 stop:6410 length:2877 start_codon:yes stop_codon:yes gene_type:complete
MALDRGKRSSLVSGNISVNKSQTSGLGAGLEAFGQTALKIAEQQAAVMDEIWKGDFKVKTAKFLNDLSIEQESMDMPDLASAQQQILGYKEQLINSSSTRYSKYIENYLDLKGIDTLDGLRKRSNAIMYNNVSGAINNELDLLVNGTFNSVNKITENPDILTPIDFRNEVEKVFENASLDISDINFGAAQSLNPLEYNDQFIANKVDSNLIKLEATRMYGIAMSMYKGVDFSNLDEVAAADAKVLEFKENYLSGKEKRLSNNFDMDTININVKAFEDNVKQIKSFNQAAIDASTQVQSYAQIVLKNDLQNAINGNSTLSMEFFKMNDQNSLYPQLAAVGLEDDENLIQTFLDKKDVYDYISGLNVKENISPNNINTYFSHIKHNMNLDIFESKEELQEFITSYKLNQLNLNSVYQTGKTYTTGDWFNEFNSEPANQQQATIQMNDLIRNEGIVTPEIQGEINSIYNVLGKGELEGGDISKVTSLYQAWEFITNENPLAISNMDDVDNSFFLYVQEQGGLQAIDLQGADNLYSAYLKRVDVINSNSSTIQTNQEEILNDELIQDAVDAQLTAEMVDAVMNDEALNSMFMPLWNSIMKNPDYQFSTDNPLSSFIQLKEGFITGKGGQMSDMNFLQMVGIKGQQTINRAFDLINPLSNNYFNKIFTGTFFEVKPEVRDVLNQSIINQLPNFMNIELFNSKPEEAKARFAEVAPDILKTVIRNINDEGYSISVLGNRLAQPELMKFGYETEMANAGYSEEDMMTRTAYDIGAILKSHQQAEGDDWMYTNFGFLYRDEDRFVQPTLKDIKDSLANGDFSIVPVKGADQPIYQVFVNNMDSNYRSIPLGNTGNEKITVEAFDSEKVDVFATPISKKQITNTIVQNLINDPNSLFNKFEPFQGLPQGMKEFIVKSFTVTRPETEVVLEPLVEFITGGRYDYKSIQDELDKYIDVEYTNMYKDYLD